MANSYFYKRKKITDKLSGYNIIIPLHMPLNDPCDFINQIANVLSKNNKVIFFEPKLPYSWKEIININNLNKYLHSLKKILNLGLEKVYFRPLSLLPGQRFKVIYKLNLFFGILQLNFLLLFLNKKIVWGFDPSMIDITRLLGNAIYIYDCVDYWGEDRLTKSVRLIEEKLLNKVDLIVFNSKGLMEAKCQKYNFIREKSFSTVWGCNYEFFTQKIETTPARLQRLKGKKIIYIGSFDWRIDTELLKYIISKNKHYVFLLIGAIDKTVSKEFYKLLKSNNVIYCGLISKIELLLYLKSADAGIIPYNTKYKFNKYCHPMKTYEYLTAGIPVISTKITALEDYPKEIIYTTDSYEEFNQEIRSLIDNWSQKSKELALKIAKQNTWEKKIDMVGQKIIEKYEN